MTRIVADKVNVLFVIIQMEMGGAERLVYNVISKIDRNVFNPSVAWFFGDMVLDEFKALGIPLYHIPKNKRVDFSAMRMFGELIKQNEIHIVNAHNFMSFVYSFYGCKISNRIKLIYSEHSSWEIEGISWKWKKIGHYMLRCSDGLVGVSPRVSKRLQEIFRTKAAKAFTIQNGVYCESFVKATEEKGLKEQLGIKDSAKVIGMVGNFKRIKNHIFLLKAFEGLIKEFPEIKLLIIGKGFEGDEEVTKELQDFVNEKGLSKDILFLGYRSDIPDLLNIMDIFCLTSFKEGLPISLIEAMAAGLPIVGTDVEGIRDVIIPGRNGFLVQIADVIGMKDVLKKLLLDASLRERMGRESRNLALSNYTLNQCVQDYQNLFLSLC